MGTASGGRDICTETGTAWCVGETKFTLANAGSAGARSRWLPMGGAGPGQLPARGALGSPLPAPRPPGMSYQGCHSARPHTHLQEPPTCPGQMLPTLAARSPHRTCRGVHTCDISTQGTVRTGPTCRAASAESARGHATRPCTCTHTPRPHTPRPHTQAVMQAHGARTPTGVPSGWGQAVWLALGSPLPLGDSGEP